MDGSSTTRKARRKQQQAAEAEVAKGPEVEHDALVAQIVARNREDAERASSAGESREEIGAFLDATNLHPKAFSAMRTGMKIVKDGARMDWLRSMELILPMVATHLRGQTPDLFDGAPDPFGDQIEALDDQTLGA